MRPLYHSSDMSVISPVGEYDFRGRTLDWLHFVKTAWGPTPMVRNW